MVADAFNPNTWEKEASGSLCVWDQSGLHGELRSAEAIYCETLSPHSPSPKNIQEKEEKMSVHDFFHFVKK